MSGMSAIKLLEYAPMRRLRSLFSGGRKHAVWPIRTKVLAFTFGLVALLTAGDLTVNIHLVRAHAARQTADALVDLASGFARVIAVESVPLGRLGSSTAAHIVKLNPMVGDVYVLDREGGIVAEEHETAGQQLGRALHDPPVLRAMIDRKPTVAVEKAVVTAVAPVVHPRGDTVGYVVLRGPVILATNHVFSGLVIAEAVFLAVGSALAIWFSFSLTRPIEALAAAATRIARGEPVRPVAAKTRDELAILADALNRMMSRTAASNAAHEGAERDLAAAVARAETASRAKSEFLAGVSHELRTPLNAIIGFSDLLTGARASALADSKRREYAGDINRAGRTLLTLVCDILDYAQIDAGGMDLSEEPIDLAQIVRSVVSDFGPIADENGIMLTVEVASGLPVFQGDGERLYQAIGNLVSNAIRFTRTGGYVAVSLARDGGDAMVLRIADNGVGIAEGDIEAALMPFGHPPRHTGAPAHGIGLGLPLARKLIELHRGTFRIESYLNVGTVVTVRLPPERNLDPREPAPTMA
jgi:signal transduction histidine kinase